MSTKCKHTDDLEHSDALRDRSAQYCSSLNRIVLGVVEGVVQMRQLPDVESAEDSGDPTLPRPGTLAYYEPLLKAARNARYQISVLNRRFSRSLGDVVVCGYGAFAQLGCGEDVTSSPIPRLLPDLKGVGVEMVAAGGVHNLALTQQGKVYSWGCGDDGSLGVAPKEEGFLPSMVTEFRPSEFGPNKRNNKDIVDPNTGALIPFEQRKDAFIVQIAAGATQSLALSDEGDVYFFGAYRDNTWRNIRHIPPGDDTRTDTGRRDMRVVDEGERHDYYSPMGTQDWPSHLVEIQGRVKDISCGAQFCAAILEDDTILTWGLNEDGALGRSNEPITRAMNMDYIKENYLKPAPPRWEMPLVEREVVMIACGGGHFMVVMRDGTQGEFVVYSCGSNDRGQLGHGDTESRDKLRKIEYLDGKNIATVAGGPRHSMFLTMDGGALYGCGHAGYGQLGCTFERTDHMEKTPVRIPLVYEPEMAEDDGTYAGISNPSEYCIIEKNIVEEDQPKIVQLSCGSYHNLAVTSDGDVYAWGCGKTGACGQGTIEGDVLRPKLMEPVDGVSCAYKYVSGGVWHTVALIVPR